MNFADIDAGDRRGYKEGIPMPGAAPRRGPEPFCEMERSLDTGDKEYLPLIDPASLKDALPAGAAVRRTVAAARKDVRNILMKADPRLLVVVGPCSIHDGRAALDYARRLLRLQEQVAGTMVLVMRAYFEKPRTCTGWKGLLSDPHLDGTCDMTEGLRRARRILLDITAMGIPAATEMLEPTTPAYIADLISWAAVGARTAESQTHREMASGLSMPVGFKNSTDGNPAAALNAIRSAASPQTFPGIAPNGRTGIIRTPGNPWGHLVLRGGTRPNYHPENISDVRRSMAEKGLSEVLMIDCSHGNSRGDHRRQREVWNASVRQRIEGADAIIGLMLESHLHEGRQAIPQDSSDLAYGVSITDACIGWEETESLLMQTHHRLKTDPAAAAGKKAMDGKGGRGR